MTPLASLCVTSSLLLAGDGYGIRPRGSPSDYPAHQTAGGITIAGAVIPPAQCRRMFSADIDKAGYVVIEVAIYPENNREVELSSTDFMLRISSESDATRAVNARTLAACLYKTANHQPKLGPPIDAATSSPLGWENCSGPLPAPRPRWAHQGSGL